MIKHRRAEQRRTRVSLVSVHSNIQFTDYFFPQTFRNALTNVLVNTSLQWRELSKGIFKRPEGWEFIIVLYYRG